ncbi:MAG: MFS transporter [Verrucomicrobiae bacterium]|nr:MFS transporter [Verrucomicrobiae bacterium]
MGQIPPIIAHPRMLDELRTLPRPVWLLFAGTFVNKFGTFVMPFLTLYLTKAGYSKAEAGFALGAYGVGHFGASAIGGYLADLIGRRKTITLSMLSASAAMLMLPLAGSICTITLAAFFAGLTAELYRPAASALLADLIKPENRITAFAAYRFSFNAGWALGPATAGFLAQYSYNWLFAGEAITCTLFGALAWFTLPKGVRSTADKASWSAALRVIAKDRGYKFLVSSYLAIGFIMFQMMTTVGVFVIQLGLSEADFGRLLSLNGLLIICLELPLVSVTRRLPTGFAIAGGYLLFSLSMVVQAFSHNFPMLIVAMILFTLGEMVAFPIASAYIANRAPADMRGRYMGLIGFVWSTSMILSPWTGLRLLEISPTLLWLTCAGAGLVAATMVFRVHQFPNPNDAD